MKSLFLLRHAKALPATGTQADYDRPLSDRGRLAALTMGQKARTLGLDFALVCCSPAVRTRQTWTQFAAGFGACPDIIYDERFYLAHPTTLLDRLHILPETIPSVLFIGHNPGLEELAHRLDPAGFGDTAYPTAALAHFAVAGEWATLTPETAQLQHFWRA